MRHLRLAALLLLLPLISNGETVKQWVDAAPKGDIRFTAWDGDSLQANSSNGIALLPQGFYGYLDLSHLPADAFPVKLRLLYNVPDSHDIVINGKLQDPAPIGKASVIEETTFRTASEASAVPVWNASLPIQSGMGFQNQEECARAEIQSNTGTVLGRMLIGVTAAPHLSPRAVLVDTPEANQAFAGVYYHTISEVNRLVPDSYAYLNVDTIWIDAATASDPALSDAFWQQVLLGGTTVAGHPEDISKLTHRLGLGANEPVLLGKLVGASSPEVFTSIQGQINPETYATLDLNGTLNPFAFPVKIGKSMHDQLLNFSEYYLGTFVILQVVVIVVAFLVLRGTRRVWLWVAIPAFALIYTVAGIILARVVVQARSNEQVAQVELQHEGWPQSLLLTHLEKISLTDKDAIFHLSAGSKPYVPSQTVAWSRNENYFATYSLRDSELTIQSRAATRVTADVRSVLDSSPPPFEATNEGLLTFSRNFSGAWLWDGTQWRNLGPHAAHEAIGWKTAPVIHVFIGSGSHFAYYGDDDDFPSVLKPLFNGDNLKAFSSAGEGLFLGLETTATNVEPENEPNDQVASRHIVAYQFHLPGGSP